MAAAHLKQTAAGVKEDERESETEGEREGEGEGEGEVEREGEGEVEGEGDGEGEEDEREGVEEDQEEDEEAFGWMDMDEEDAPAWDGGDPRVAEPPAVLDNTGAPPATRNAEDSIVARIALCPNKAGMEKVDQQKANRIILRMSEGSRFFKNEQRKDAKTTLRVQQLVAKARAFPADMVRQAERGLRSLERLLEAQRDLSRVVVHVDADAFYASVEERDHPWLKDKPIGIGGMSMLSTANYHARRFGVRSAMPGYIAKKLCPDLILVKGRPQAYSEASKAIQAVLALYDPNFHAVSLDEAYLDITDYIQRLSAQARAKLPLDESCTVAERVVHEMRLKITAATRLTVSAGIACNTMLAKIGSDQRKPDGQVG